MFQYLTPAFPQAILLGGLYYQEFCCSSLVRALTLWSLIVSAAAWVVLAGTPYENPLLKYIVGFMSCWYIIWAANLLLMKDVRTFGRVQRTGETYVWESVPARHSLNRLEWALDLTLNFRAIGWSFSKQTARHPPILQPGEHDKDNSTSPKQVGSAEPDVERSTFAKRQMRRLLVAGLWLGVYTHLIHATALEIPVSTQMQDYIGDLTDDPISALPQIAVLIDLWSIAATLYFFQDGIHALIGLVHVMVFSGETWRYPPYFGAVKYLLSGRLQDIWGSFWHDLLKEGLLSVAKGIIPQSRPRALFSLLRIWFCFSLTGAVHAAASYTVSREVTPSLYAGVFYCLQPVGISFQMFIAMNLRRLLPKDSIILQLINAAVGLIWLRYCFPWVSGDPALRQAIDAIYIL